MDVYEDQNLKIELDNLRQKDKEARKKADKKLKGKLDIFALGAEC